MRLTKGATFEIKPEGSEWERVYGASKLEFALKSNCFSYVWTGAVWKKGY